MIEGGAPVVHPRLNTLAVSRDRGDGIKGVKLARHRPAYGLLTL